MPRATLPRSSSRCCPAEVHSAWCSAPHDKTLLSSQPSGGTDMSAACHVAEEQLGVLPG